MARDYSINGEVLVQVRGNGALVLSGNIQDFLDRGQPHRLGLCLDSVRIIPRFYHQDIKADDFGPNVPPEVMYTLADVRIQMTLVHFDYFVLDGVIAECMAGGVDQSNNNWAGIMAPAGTMMGNNRSMGTLRPSYLPGNHFVGLHLTSPILNYPWRFPTAYLTDPPIMIPLGTKLSEVQLNWRAIPYKEHGTSRNEIISSGTPLWFRDSCGFRESDFAGQGEPC